ncbi:hypothetical protein, partial [uncultured Pseudoalteromonas sp.]|uniref:hypothetical protein n=1 Tax=uncultured Pseudoalteromonas sp. TaxID=114053 RepID=UPI00259631B6
FIIFSCVYNKRKFYVWHLLFFGGITKPLSNLFTKRVRGAALLEKNKSLVIIARNISLASAGLWIYFLTYFSFFSLCAKAL